MNTDTSNDEVVREIAGRRVHVLQKFADFEEKAVEKRRLLVESSQLQYFLRTSQEFQNTLESLIESIEGVTIRHSADHSARSQKTLNRVRGEVEGRREELKKIDREASILIEKGHYAADEIQKKFNEIVTRWEYLLKLLNTKWQQVQKELDSIEFRGKCEVVLNWIIKTKTVEKPDKAIFDEIRKYTVLWNDVLATYQQIPDPSSIDTENFEKVRSAWEDFQQYVDLLHKEMNEHERLQKFIDNAEYLIRWIEDKEKEIRIKYSNLNVEESMKYRKTIEIEIKSTEQRIKDLNQQLEDFENLENDQVAEELRNNTEQVKERFDTFEKFIEKWIFDLEIASNLDTLLKEADDIRFWCTEKMEDLQAMVGSESVDCDELAMWIETNEFDFNSWDSVLSQFLKSAKELLPKLNDQNAVSEVEKTKQIFQLAKDTSTMCNKNLKARIEIINVEKLIYQSHQKAYHLTSVLQKNEKVLGEIKIEDAEKDLLMMDGIDVRCASVIEQIEHIQQQVENNEDQRTQLSKTASDQLDNLAQMKEILKSSPALRKIQLRRVVDVAYFIESCCEIRKRSKTILDSLRSGKIRKESVQPIKEQIRTNRLKKWSEYFNVMDEIRGKEQVLDQMTELKNGTPEAVLTDVERKCEVLDAFGEQLDSLKIIAEQISSDEFVRTKTVENAVEKLRTKWFNVSNTLTDRRSYLKEMIESSKFAWKCDTAIQCIRDQEEKIVNLVRQQKPTSSFEYAAYHSTMSFVDSYSKETVEKLISTSKQLEDQTEANAKLTLILDRLDSLKKHLGLLSEKIDQDKHRKQRVQDLQDKYSKQACDLGNWLEQAEEEVAGVVNFQTKETSEGCLKTLVEILKELRNEKVELLGDLELLEVELAELNEDVSTFTWYSYKTLANRVSRLDQSICDRVKVVKEEIRRHLENENICQDAANTLQMCRNVILEVKKEFDHLHSLKLDDQRDKLLNLIEKVQGSGMVGELERWRSVMGSRYIFNNKFTSVTPHGVLVDTYQILELMSSMLRSVEQSIADRNSSGVTEKQLREFELAFEYFDQEKNGWLDYEHFDLCIKSQGYAFTIEGAPSETMELLDPTKSGHIFKAEYMRWMIKNETTNILDDHSAIENALKSLNARNISDSMSRKEAEFFMRKIAKHTETFTEHVHLGYKDFVDSFF